MLIRRDLVDAQTLMAVRRQFAEISRLGVDTQYATGGQNSAIPSGKRPVISSTPYKYESAMAQYNSGAQSEGEPLTNPVVFAARL